MPGMTRLPAHPKPKVSWGRSRGGAVESKCGRFKIHPIYGGLSRPGSFRLAFKSPHGDWRDIGANIPNQREAREEAERFLEDPVRRYAWRQDSPYDQLVVILMAIEGDVDNLHRIGFCPDVEGARRSYGRLDYMFHQAHDLLPYLRKGSW
jgi:hypothetical protein